MANDRPACGRCKRWLPDGNDEGIAIKSKTYCRHCSPELLAELNQPKVRRVTPRIKPQAQQG